MNSSVIFFDHLHGHTTWQGPLLCEGVKLGFSLCCCNGGTNGERMLHVHLMKDTGSFSVQMIPHWAADFHALGISLITGGRGLPTQLTRLLGRITGFEVRLQAKDEFLLHATLQDDESREGLRWHYRREIGGPSLEEILRPVTPECGHPRPFYEVYPRSIGVAV